MATKSSPMEALRLATAITSDTTVRFAALMGSKASSSSHADIPAWSLAITPFFSISSWALVFA